MSASCGKTVTLVSNEGNSFEVSVGVAKMSKYVKSQLEEIEPSTIVRLSTIHTGTLSKVIEFGNHYRKVERMVQIQRPLRSRMSEMVQPWYADFVDSMDQRSIFELFVAARHLEIPPLMELASAKAASVIKGMSPEKQQEMMKASSSRQGSENGSEASRGNDGEYTVEGDYTDEDGTHEEYTDEDGTHEEYTDEDYTDEEGTFEEYSDEDDHAENPEEDKMKQPEDGPGIGKNVKTPPRKTAAGGEMETTPLASGRTGRHQSDTMSPNRPVAKLNQSLSTPPRQTASATILLAVAYGNTIDVINTNTESIVTQIKPHEDSIIGSFVWNHNGQVIASCPRSPFRESVVLTSFLLSRPLESFSHDPTLSKQGKSQLSCLSFAHKSRYLLCGDQQKGSVSLWDLKKMARVREYQILGKQRAPVQLEMTDSLVIVLFGDGIQVFDLRGATLYYEIENNSCRYTKFVRIGSLLWIGRSDGKIDVLNDLTMTRATVDNTIDLGLKSPITDICLSPNSKLLALASAFDVHFFEVSTGELVSSHGMPGATKCLSLGREKGAIGLESGDILVFNLDDVESLESVKQLRIDGDIVSMGFCPVSELKSPVRTPNSHAPSETPGKGAIPRSRKKNEEEKTERRRHEEFGGSSIVSDASESQIALGTYQVPSWRNKSAVDSDGRPPSIVLSTSQETRKVAPKPVSVNSPSNQEKEGGSVKDIGQKRSSEGETARLPKIIEESIHDAMNLAISDLREEMLIQRDKQAPQIDEVPPVIQQAIERAMAETTASLKYEFDSHLRGKSHEQSGMMTEVPPVVQYAINDAMENAATTLKAEVVGGLQYTQRDLAEVPPIIQKAITDALAETAAAIQSDFQDQLRQISLPVIQSAIHSEAEANEPLRHELPREKQTQTPDPALELSSDLQGTIHDAITESTDALRDELTAKIRNLHISLLRNMQRQAEEQEQLIGKLLQENRALHEENDRLRIAAASNKENRR